MINCVEEGDGSFTITWDENDPLECILNSWTEQDFIDAIMKECQKVLKEHESSTTDS